MLYTDRLVPWAVLLFTVGSNLANGNPAFTGGYFMYPPGTRKGVAKKVQKQVKLYEEIMLTGSCSVIIDWFHYRPLVSTAELATRDINGVGQLTIRDILSAVTK